VSCMAESSRSTSHNTDNMTTDFTCANIVRIHHLPVCYPPSTNAAAALKLYRLQLIMSLVTTTQTMKHTFSRSRLPALKVFHTQLFRHNRMSNPWNIQNVQLLGIGLISIWRYTIKGSQRRLRHISYSMIIDKFWIWGTICLKIFTAFSRFTLPLI